VKSILALRGKKGDWALTGSLKDFGLTDIFQLLGQQQKTGVLTLQEGKKVIQILFDQGLIIGTDFPFQTAEGAPLGRMLIRGGLLDPEEWGKACSKHKDELSNIGRFLVESGVVRGQDLTTVLRLLAFETIFGLFRWEGGNFRFEAKEVLRDPIFGEPMNTEYLLLEVIRMLDEWPMLAERIPNFDIVLRKEDANAGLDVLRGTPWEEKRTPQMELIYGLVNGQRTIRQIIDLSLIGEFDTCKNLITLSEAGLLDPTLVWGMEKKRRISGLGKPKVQVGASLLVGILIFLLILQLAVFRWKGFPLSRGERAGWRAFQDPLGTIEGEKAANAREVFFLEENRYPADPSEMTQKNLLTREEVLALHKLK